MGLRSGVSRSGVTGTALVLWLAVVCGCGSGSGGSNGDLVPAIGKVTLNGQPLAGATLNLIPQEGVKGKGGYAVSGADGSFAFQISPEEPGVAAGKYVLVARKFTMPDGSAVPDGASAANSGAINALPPQYADPGMSKLFVSFPVPESQPLTLDLKSRGR